jgi:hypothetical protein
MPTSSSCTAASASSARSTIAAFPLLAVCTGSLPRAGCHGNARGEIITPRDPQAHPVGDRVLVAAAARSHLASPAAERGTQDSHSEIPITTGKHTRCNGTALPGMTDVSIFWDTLFIIIERNGTERPVTALEEAWIERFKKNHKRDKNAKFKKSAES